MLMVPFLTAGPLTLDEHGSYWLLESDTPSTTLKRSLGYAAIPPLSAWVQLVFVNVGGRTELMLRLPSAIAFVLSIVVVWQLGRELGGDVMGGVSALLLAWHPEAMDEVRIARCYGLVMLLSAVSFWMTVRWARSPARWGYAIGWALSGAGLLWTHYMTAPVLVLELTTLCGFRALGPKCSPAEWKRLLTAVVLVVFLAAPLIPAVMRMAEWSPYLSLGHQPSTLWSLFGPIWMVGLGVGWLVARGLSFRVLSPGSNDCARSVLVTLLIWGLVPLLFMTAVTHMGLAGLNNPRYRVAFAVPAVCCLATVLTRGHKPSAAIWGAVALLVSAWSFQASSPWQPSHLVNAERYDWRQIAGLIERDGHPGEPLFVQSGLVESYLVPVFFEDRLFMDYVSCRLSTFYLRTPHPRYALPFLWSDQTGMIAYFSTVIREQAKHGDTVWVACATDTDLNRNSLAAMKSLLQEVGYRVVEQTDFATAALVHYELGGLSPIKLEERTGR